MLIGAIQIELAIPWAMSIKDKRRAIKGLIQRVQTRFRASCAEVGDNDNWRNAIIGVAVVSNDVKHLQSICQKIVNFIEEHDATRLEDFAIEII